MSEKRAKQMIWLNRLPSLGAVVDVGSVVAPWVNHERLPYPYRMTLVVTRQCNSRCKMCNIWQQKELPQLSLDEYKQIFDQNNFWFLRSVTLTGGEPTMRKDLPDVFRTVAQGCPNLEHVYLATSALNTQRTLRYVEQILNTAQECLPKLSSMQVQISVDGIAEVHDEVRGILGFFNRVQETLDGLEALQANYPILSMRLSTVVLPQNVGNVPAVREFAARRRLPIHLSPVIISGGYYTNEKESSDLVAERPDGSSHMAQLFTELGEEDLSSLRFHYRDIASMFHGAERSRRCMMGLYDFVLEYNGDVYACVNCETYSFGNLFEVSFEDLWFGPKATQARQSLRKNCCPTCPSPCHAPAIDAGELLQIKWQGLQHRLASLTSKA